MRTAVEALIRDVTGGCPAVSKISARFHNGLAACVLEICSRIRSETGLDQVGIVWWSLAEYHPIRTNFVTFEGRRFQGIHTSRGPGERWRPFVRTSRDRSGKNARIICVWVFQARSLKRYEKGGLQMAKVDFGGVFREACLTYVPEAKVGEYCIIHVGFAISVLSESEALETLELTETDRRFRGRNRNRLRSL